MVKVCDCCARLMARAVDWDVPQNGPQLVKYCREEKKFKKSVTTLFAFAIEPCTEATPTPSDEVPHSTENQTHLKIMKKTILSFASVIIASGLLSTPAKADPMEAADKAYEMAAKYHDLMYYFAPVQEGYAGHGVTIEFEVNVNRGLDYVFIAAGDKACKDVNIYVEAEGTRNTIKKDTRPVDNGLAGVGWRSDYNGVVNVGVHFAKATDRCGWTVLAGRRGTLMTPRDNTDTAVPGASTRVDSGSNSGGDFKRE